MNQAYVIGADIGGTNTALALVDARGNILCRNTIKTAAYATAADYADAFCICIQKMIDAKDLSGRLRGIGIGAPTANYNTGVIEKSVNIPWVVKQAVPLAAMITERTGLPCMLTNDANAAAMGEMMYGAARGKKDFIVITLGTGVGSGVVCGGQLLAGHDGMAGELGHIIVRREGRLCGCGRKGCLETYTSATGVARTAVELLAADNRPSLLRSITEHPINSKDVFEAAQHGDTIAIEVFNYTGRILGEALADFVAFSGPEMIILFGGLSAAGDFLLKPTLAAMEENMLFLYKGKTKLCLSELNEADSALLGASALAWESK